MLFNQLSKLFNDSLKVRVLSPEQKELAIYDGKNSIPKSFDLFEVSYIQPDWDTKYLNVEIDTSKKRFDKNDIYMDSEITDGKPEEIVGYMWATEILCNIAEYEGFDDGDDYINFYPTYNVLTETFYVQCSGMEFGNKFDKILELTDEEKYFIFSVFIKTYWGTDENFSKEVKEWRNAI